MSFAGNIGSFWRRFLNGVINRISGQTPVKALEGPQAFRSIFLVGLVALGVGGWVIWHSIHLLAQPPGSNINTNSSPSAIAQLDKLKTKDTDGDGLSDYNELFGLHTSPYLKDSDSDGISDKNDASPNCPQNQVCSGTVGATTDANGQLTPEFLRAALRASGVPQATLDQIKDDDLLNIYQQVVAQEPAGNINVAPTIDSLEGLSGSDIRQLLIQSGVDAATLQQVDDATLKQIFAQAIQQ